MKRREFILLLGGAAVAWPLAAPTAAVGQQQTAKNPRIGFQGLCRHQYSSPTMFSFAPFGSPFCTKYSSDSYFAHQLAS